MALDPEFYELAVHFPEAVLALLGLRPTGPVPRRGRLGMDLFTRFLSERLKTVDVYASLKSEEDAVENTATGRALLARGEAKGLRTAMQARGFVVPVDVQDRLNAEGDVARLDAILAAAVRVGPDLSGLFPD